jgi:hypothetical protein
VSLSTQVAALATRIGVEIKSLRTSQATAHQYLVPIYVLEVGQTVADVPPTFPAGGLVFQKTS